VRAISAETGRTAWLHEQRAGTMSLVATGGGLLFGGDVKGRFRAFDDETGEVLWEFNLGSAVTGFPISYAVDGRQYIAVGTGYSGTSGTFTALAPELRPSRGNNLISALMCGSTSSIRAMCASTTSSGLVSPTRIRRANSAAPNLVISPIAGPRVVEDVPAHNDYAGDRGRGQRRGEPEARGARATNG